MKRVLNNILVAGLVFSFCGCVSAPKKGQLQSFTISGTTYFSLMSLCDVKGLKWDYDSLTRTADVTRDSHRLKVQAGAKVVFVDGSQRRLNEPVDIYRGMLVVPGQFREVVEKLFPECSPLADSVSFYKIRKVIIDPGHGGKDPGAPGRNGMEEKDVVLDISRRLSALLRQYGVETSMTRSTDVFIPLEKRAGFTEDSQADLFISIHANANPSRSLSGFEVYYISPEVSDYKRALNSAKYSPLKLESGSLASSDGNLKAILWDMTHTYNRGESIKLSRDICKSIGGSLDTRVIGIKSANYCVLRGACIPAILVEVGFLSNKREEQLLNDPQYRQKIARAIKDGIQDYARSAAGSGINYNIARSSEGSR